LEILLGGPATAADIIEMAQEFHGETGHAVTLKQLGALRNLMFDAALGRAYLLVLDDEPAGYATVMFRYSIDHAAKIGFVDDLYVRPNARGKGRGTALLQAIEADLRKLGLAALSLHAEPKGRAEALYRRYGFKPDPLSLLQKDLG